MVQVLQRVEEIRVSQHARLRMALQRASRAISDLKEAQQEAFKGPSTVDMFGDPVARQKAEEEAASNPLRRINLGPVLKVWAPFESLILERVDTWEMDLWPLVQRWSMGEPVAGAVQAVASGMVARRQKLEPLLREVRVQASFVGQLRPAMVAVFGALDAADAVEAEVVPSLIAGRADLPPATLEGTTPVTMSSESITRNLRSQGRTMRPGIDAPEKPKRKKKSTSPLAWLEDLFKKLS